MNKKKKTGRRGASVRSRSPKGRGFLNYKKIFPIIILACLFVLSLSAAGYVIFFRTVST